MERDLRTLIAARGQAPTANPAAGAAAGPAVDLRASTTAEKTARTSDKRTAPTSDAPAAGIMPLGDTTTDVDLACTRLQAHMARVPHLVALAREVCHRNRATTEAAESALHRTGARGRFLRHCAAAKRSSQISAQQREGRAADGNAASQGSPLAPRAAEKRVGTTQPTSTASSIDAAPSFFNSQGQLLKTCTARSTLLRSFLEQVETTVLDNPAFLNQALREWDLLAIVESGRASFGAEGVMSNNLELATGRDLSSTPVGVTCGTGSSLHHPVLDHIALKRMQNRKWALAQVEQGVLRNAEHNFEAAIRCYDKALQLDRRCADAYVGRGAARVNLRQFGRAIEDFEQALVWQPGHENARKYLQVAKRKFGLPDAPSSATTTHQLTLHNPADKQSPAESNAGRDSLSESSSKSRKRPTKGRFSTGNSRDGDDASSSGGDSGGKSRRSSSSSNSDGNSSDSASDSESPTVSRIMRLLIKEKMRNAGVGGSSGHSAPLVSAIHPRSLVMLCF
eukprot:INCI12813.2.p1 GENE.INCI12813.2~~INCI12813.2.p1  ORF type:complete len:531 (-),score=101.97 INCI12813.2:34-1560(-)